jgi:ornithine cyclodeaminase
VTVTQLRTGAASGVAFDVLGRKDAKKGALIGTGGQAATQLEAMICARDLETVHVFDQNSERTKAFVKQMNEELKDYGTQILPAETSDEAINDADLIITVTPATSPVFDGSKVKAGATVSCVGSYQPHMQEMDPVILERASKLYFDSEEAVLSEAGDILIPLEDGIITKDDFTGDIGEVLMGKIGGRENDEEIIVFKTVGIGAQDLVTAQKIYERALEEKIGTEWS